MKHLLKWRRPLVIGFHIIATTASNLGAFWLRFDGSIPAAEFGAFWRLMPWLFVIRGLSFYHFRLFEGMWRYAGVWDLRNIIFGVGSSTAALYVVVWLWPALKGYPRSVLVIDSLLLVFVLGGSRLLRRLIGRLRKNSGNQKRVLIFGAGDAGEMVVRDMKDNPYYAYYPIGFIDDDREKTGTRIHGVAVLGTRESLSSIVRSHQPHEVLVAMPSGTPATIRQVIRALEPYRIPIQTLPNLRDVMDGRLLVSQIRSLRIEDLLTRAPVGLDVTPVKRLVSDKCVLVSGAGGSIGSELCRQILQADPARLIMLDRYENGLFTIQQNLSRHANNRVVKPLIGDITDAGQLERLFATENPSVVFHAAAHKHVPMMEMNPSQAVKNNVRGTRLIAEAARRSNVGQFVLISTDKAVNPTSVMGATKRIAERLVQRLGRGACTRFTTVRFGNVLGSNGSVVPTFLEQIRSGGPVTVTHPEMRRYFMLIPEAVQLVLHAAAIGGRDCIYVLRMGDQINVAGLARNLIRLSGFVPDEDIEVVFTGIRPGEKLFEELLGPDEFAEPSEVPDVQRVRAAPEVDSHDDFMREVERLEQAAERGADREVLESLKELVPSLAQGRVSTAYQ